MSLTIDQLTEIIGFELSDEQVESVTANLDEPLLVVAGAGSGKTTVMAARVIWAVGTGAVTPDQVVGLTFTNKAAGELAARLRVMLSKLSESGRVDEQNTAEPVVSTYHSFAQRLVAEHGLRIGVEPGMRLMSDDEAVQWAYRVLVRSKLPLGPLGNSVPSAVEKLLSLDDRLAEHAVEPEQLREADAELVSVINSQVKPSAAAKTAAEVASKRMLLSLAVDELRAARLAADVMTFSDLMRFGVQIAETHPEVGQLMREQFPLVLLDEYQDTSVSQTRMLSALFSGGFSDGHGVTAVGDPLQGIYGWRGASASAVDDFATIFRRRDGDPARLLHLSHSRRSGPLILEVANRVAAPLRAGHSSVVLESARPVDATNYNVADTVRCALFETRDGEIEWLTSQVASFVEAGVPPEEIAVLMRKSSDFEPVAEALAARGVPCHIANIGGLLAQPEVRELLSVLEVISDPTANPAMLRLLTGPRWRIGDRDLAILGRRAADLARAEDESGLSACVRSPLDIALDQAVSGTDPVDVLSLAEAVADPGEVNRYRYSDAARDRFSQISTEFDLLRQRAFSPLEDLVGYVGSLTGLDVEVARQAIETAGDVASAGYDRGTAALANITEIASNFTDLDGASDIGSFLAWLRAAARFNRSMMIDVPVRPGAVALTTVHKAKGLEWTVVVVPFLSEGGFTSASRGNPRWTKDFAMLPHSLRGDRDALPTLCGHKPKDYEEFDEAMKVCAEEEDRRLAYVAVTRAECALLGSAHWWGPTQKTLRGPAQYLAEMRDALMAFGVEVAVWATKPDDDVTNPALEVQVQEPWPVAVPPDVHARRMRGVELVESAMNGQNPSRDADLTPSETLTPAETLTPSETKRLAAWDDDLELLLAEQRSASGDESVTLPGALSASDVMRLAADPTQFAEGLLRPMPRRPSPAARRGTSFHLWVEESVGQRALFDELPGALDEPLVSDDELDELKAGFWRSPFGDRVPYAVEVPFALIVGGRVIRGRIDAVYRTGDGWEVIDWKTNLKKDADQLQLAIYRIAWAQLQGIGVAQVRGAFVYVRHGEAVYYNDLPDIDALEAILVP